MGDFDQSFSAGLQGGLQAASQGIQTQVARNNLQQLQGYQQDVHAIISNPNPDPQQYAQLALKYPQFAQQVQTAQGVQQVAKQNADLTTASQAYASAQSGDFPGAIGVLQNKLVAQQNSGASQADMQGTQHMIDLLQQAPGMATKTMGIWLAHSLGPDKFTSAFGAINTAQNANELQPAAVQQAQGQADITTANAAQAPQAAALANQKTQADIQNTLDTMQNRAATFGLDTDKFNADTQMRLQQLQYEQRVPKLGEGQGQVQAQSVAESVQAQQMAAQASELAQQLRNAPADESSGGLWQTITQKYRSATGQQNSVDALRKQYAQLRAQGMGSLKFGGTMTNQDLEIIKDGFPADNAPLPQVATWLDSFSRLQARAAQAQNAKAEWIAQAGSVGTAPQDIRVAGVLVPKGMSFNEFLSKNPNLGEPLAQPNIKTAPGQPGPGAGVLTPQNGPNAAPAQPSYMKYAE
jgi:hypothetical protein